MYGPVTLDRYTSLLCCLVSLRLYQVIFFSLFTLVDSSIKQNDENSARLFHFM